MAKTKTTSTSPEDFDLTAWLAGTDPEDITVRPYETVTVYKQAADIDAALAEVKAAEDAVALASAKTRHPARDQAVGEANGPTLDDLQKAVDAAKKKASKIIGERRLDVTVYQLIRPEVDAVVKGYKPGTNEYLYQVLAVAARLPGGVKVDADQWASIHGVIGQAQLDRLDQAVARLYTADPSEEVDAVFSQRS